MWLLAVEEVEEVEVEGAEGVVLPLLQPREIHLQQSLALLIV